jgi:hypothetical protein
MLLKRIHWLFILLFFLKDFSNFFISQNSWNLNRSIGWEYENTDFIWWVSFDLGGVYWILFFGLAYWLFQKLKYDLLAFPTYLHFILTFISFFDFREYDGLVDGLCIGQFLLNVLLIILVNKR